MDRYKDYVARCQADRIQLDVLCALERIADKIAPIEIPVQKVEVKAEPVVEMKNVEVEKDVIVKNNPKKRK